MSETYVKANAELKKPIPYKFVKEAAHGLWGHYEEMVKFMSQYTKPPVLPKRGKLVVTGYIKTRKFQIILPSINSITQCEYDFSNDLKLNLKDGPSGLVKVRLPKDMSIDSVKCSSAGKAVHISRKNRQDWQEYSFEYNDSVFLTFHKVKN